MSADESEAKGVAARVTEYFTGLAALYAAHRPSYPADALAWIAQAAPPHMRAVDVGCGTGISTRLLAAEGLTVVGIDPNADMVAEAARGPRDGVAYCAGTGEALPLRNATVGLVLCAQAFHWLDGRRALREFRRVLVDAGAVALMWNTPDLDDPVGASYAAITARARALARARGRVASTERDADVTTGNYFARADRRTFSNPQPLDLQGLLGRARSASYWPRGDAAQADLEADLQALFERHAAGGRITLPHHTVVTIGR